MRKYPVGTKITSKSSPQLSGTVVGYKDGNNTIRWHDSIVSLEEKADWYNGWSDADIKGDRDKIVTLPVLLDEDLFTL